jgi:carbamoyltransferase
MNIIGISGLHHSVPFKKKEFPRLTPRQYRIAQGFDSAAALVSSRGIEAVAAEERFTREKATGSFPVNAIQFCLNKAGLNETDIDFIAHGFTYTPFRRWYEASDFTQKQFREVYSRDAQLRTIQDHLGSANEWDRKFVEVPHHLAHAASAFYLSGFEESLILVADGMGEIHSTTIAAGKDNKIRIIRQVEAVHSLGILYGVFTYFGLRTWIGRVQSDGACSLRECVALFFPRHGTDPVKRGWDLRDSSAVSQYHAGTTRNV